jgi:hypothetical protein
MADEQPPETEAAEEDGDLIDISKLPEAKPGGLRRPAGRVQAARPTAKPGRSLLWRIMEVFTVLLVVAWVFLLGVLVGRNRPEESGHRMVIWLEKMAGWAPPQPILIDPAAEIRPAPPPEVSPEAAPEVSPDVAPEADPEADSEEEYAAPAAQRPLFAVQVLLAHDETEARNQVARLKAQGFTAYFYQNALRFPVRVGPFPTRAEAEEYRLRLEAQGYKEPYISELR